MCRRVLSDCNIRLRVDSSRSGRDLRDPEEFRAEVVRLARSFPERSIRQLANELGISATRETLRNWVTRKHTDRPRGAGGSDQKSLLIFDLTVDLTAFITLITS